MDLLVVAVGVVVGVLAIRSAGREIERKLVLEAVNNAAALIRESNLPLSSDVLLQRVGRVLGAEVASGPVDAARIEASSLSAPQRGELEQALRGKAPPAGVSLGGKSYRIASTVVSTRAGARAVPDSRLYVLVAQERIDAATRTAAYDIALATLGAIAAATVLAVILSVTISRPVIRLGRRMDELARQAQAAPAGSEAPVANAADAVGRGSPAELARLARSFDHLMGQLAHARGEVARSAGLATLGKLSASVAHELRNPLSGIRMNAQVLAEEQRRSGRTDPSLDLIIREIDRIDLYLQEMLSLAASGRTEAPAAVEAVRLDELAESVVELVAGRAGHAGVRIARRYDPSAPPAQADANRIRQVVLNLLLNAVEATPRGGEITLTLARWGESAVRFSARDSGSGVQEGLDVFEPFVTTREQGAGLGLYICRQIVQSCGGRIGYESSPQGATFWVELPAAE